MVVASNSVLRPWPYTLCIHPGLVWYLFVLSTTVSIYIYLFVTWPCTRKHRPYASDVTATLEPDLNRLSDMSASSAPLFGHDAPPWSCWTPVHNAKRKHLIKNNNRLFLSSCSIYVQAKGYPELKVIVYVQHKHRDHCVQVMVVFKPLSDWKLKTIRDLLNMVGMAFN